MDQYQGPRVYAVIVLYRRNASKSEAYVSLKKLLDAGFGGMVELLVCDNSPYEQPAPDDFRGAYLRDLTNPGLARCYNEALRRAEPIEASWLMLLDQDTVVTGEYLYEVSENAEILKNEDDIVAMVPALIDGDVVCSPIYPPMYGPPRAVNADMHGPATTLLHALNSGAVLRVSAIRKIGGFPLDFPLDYLDHATFFQLQHEGRKIFLLRSRLQHKLSSNSEPGRDVASIRRMESMLKAEARFYSRYGSPKDRFLRRFRLLRAVIGRILRGKEASQSWRLLKAAIRP